MKIISRIFFTFALCIAVLLIWAGFHKNYATATVSEFTTIAGDKLALKDLRGKPVLVTFWATTCGSCMKEIPHLVDLYQRYHPKGFELIAVAMAYDPPNQVVQFAKDNNLPYAVALDVSGEHANAFGGIWGTPTTYLIDKHGEISWETVGMFETEELAEKIEKQLL